MKVMRKLLAFVALGLFTFVLSACNEAYIEPNGENVGSFASYDQLKDYLLKFYESNGDRYYLGGSWSMLENNSVEADFAATTTDAATTPDYSRTNNQVEGVEEADKILTDGYKIYIASGSIFYIVDAETLDIDYSFEIDNGSFQGLYLYQGLVVLLSYEYNYFETEDCQYYYYGPVYADDAETVTSVDGDETVTTDSDLYTGETTEEERTYDTTEYCVNWTYTYGTRVRVLDVSDTDNVTTEREVYFDSSYLVDTRMIDENLYIVLDNYMIRYYFSEELFVPRYMDSAVSNQLVDLSPNQIYYMPNDSESFSYLILASFDVTDNNQEASIKSYLGSTYEIYMSLDNLYATIYRWNYLELEGRYEYKTFIMRFEIVDGELMFKALGEVSGSPLNQFSMDEYDGVFRIATTGYSYTETSWNIDNFMYLLDATSEGTMNQISVLNNLGKPGERIYSVRFSEETAYVVTFVQTDPLYKLDLSDPENPEIIGELYEDGVSDYLHEITDTLLLGIGRQAEEIDGWTRFTGVKVALYDTSGDTPVNLETYLVEGEYSYTNVMYDHKAFLSFTPQGADFTYVAIPVFEYYDDYLGCSQSMYLFKVYHSGDLEFVTRLTQMVEDQEGYYRYFDSIERAVIIDNYIYTLSYSSIHKFDINDEFSMVATQDLNTLYYYYYGYPISVDLVD